jgi:hypothetical protein
MVLSEGTPQRNLPTQELQNKRKEPPSEAALFGFHYKGNFE